MLRFRENENENENDQIKIKGIFFSSYFMLSLLCISGHYVVC